MAVVVERHMQEIHRESISDAKVIRNMVIPRSTISQGVNKPSFGNWIPVRRQTKSVTTVWARHRSPW